MSESFDPGNTDSSARREYERPALGTTNGSGPLRPVRPLIRFVGGEKPSTKAWKTGDEGETMTGRSLE